MADPPLDTAPSHEEVAYYRRQLDELAGDNIRLDFSISGLRHEIQQKRRGFHLLTDLLAAIGTRQEISDIFELTIGAINATLGMDRTVVLRPASEVGCYRPSQWLGFHDGADADLPSVAIHFPAEFARAPGFLLVNRATAKTALIESLQEAFDLPYFACVAVMLEDGPLALLLSGRLREARPFFPPLDQGDIDTFQAIAGLISSLLQNRRLAAVEEASRQIQEATQRKSRFLASMSHELRTPMNAIVGFTRLVLRQGGDDLPERQRGNLAKVVQSANHLLSLINDLLDLSKVEAGRMEVDTETFSLEALIGDCCAEVTPLVGPSVGLRHAVTSDIGDVHTDRRRLHQIIINLLSNAFKFTTKGEVVVNAWAEPLPDQQDGIAIAVTDTGAGIPGDALDSIFEEFQQVKGSDTAHRGTGLGLPITKGFARLLRGSIAVDSQLGTGSTFTVRIPKVFGEPEAAPAPVTTEEIADAAPEAMPDAGQTDNLTSLHHCALRGQIVAVRDHIDRVEQADPDLAALAAQLRECADCFDMERICQLLEPHVS